MFMKCHYQFFLFIFFKLNFEKIYFPKIQNVKKTKCLLKYYIETKNYCSKTKYSEISFLIQKQTTGKRNGCSVSKANIIIPLDTQGMLVKNVTNHNAWRFELLNAMHQIGCCLVRSLQARSLRQQ